MYFRRLLAAILLLAPLPGANAGETFDYRLHDPDDLFQHRFEGPITAADIVAEISHSP